LLQKYHKYLENACFCVENDTFWPGMKLHSVSKSNDFVTEKTFQIQYDG